MSGQNKNDFFNKKRVEERKDKRKDKREQRREDRKERRKEDAKKSETVASLDNSIIVTPSVLPIKSQIPNADVFDLSPPAIKDPIMMAEMNPILEIPDSVAAQRDVVESRKNLTDVIAKGEEPEDKAYTYVLYGGLALVGILSLYFFMRD
jgi:hypothetical protein